MNDLSILKAKIEAEILGSHALWLKARADVSVKRGDNTTSRIEGRTEAYRKVLSMIGQIERGSKSEAILEKSKP